MSAGESPSSASPPAPTDVVIVGAGPTGLIAAALLARCGVKVRIFDKNEQQAHESRAIGIHAKSMELFLNIALADQFMARGLIATGIEIVVDGKSVGGLTFDDIGRADTPYPFVLMLPQSQTEELLLADLHRLGIAVERQVDLVGFDQSTDGVVARVRDRSGVTSEIPCSYLIGADGAHSVVRKTLGLKFEGAAYEQNFILADCKIDWPLGHDRLTIFLHGRGVAVFMPLKGTEIGRVFAIEPASAKDSATHAPQGASELSLSEMESVLQSTAQMDVKLSDPKWTARYHLHHRGVDRYGVGRVFVAGDAAHIHSPAGGQGMNTGLQDAANLCWKLAVVLTGQAPASLLETYHAERWPVGQKVLNYTDKLFAGMTSQKEWVAWLRNKLVPLFASTLFHSSTARARVFHFVSQLGIRYHESEFVHEASSRDTPHAWRDGPCAGHRAPNGLFTRNRDVFGLLNGYRFHVLVLSRLPLSRQAIDALSADLGRLPKNCGIPIDTHVIAHSLVGRDRQIHQAECTQVFDVFGISSASPQGVFLIRPDGYIAFRKEGLDIAAVDSFIRERFHPPVPAPGP
jgi:2-polyprenyl-6-methoxyphenol hydroxylase-like FAD-dependent oxidoreductase